jgi:cytochrome P450
MTVPSVIHLPEALGGFDLTDRSRFADGVPYDVFARLRREAPILRHPAGHSADGEDFWVITRHADIAAVAADPVFSAQGGGGRTGGGTHLDDLELGAHAGALMVMMDDPRHRLIVDLLRRPAGRPATEALAEQLRGIARPLLDRALGQGPVEFAADVTGPYSAQAMGLALGVPRPDWDHLVAWNTAASNVMDRVAGTTTEASTAVAQRAFGYGQELLAAKRAAPGDDLVSVLAVGELATGHGEPPLTEYERAVNVWLMMLTGSEQSRNTIAGGVLAFALHPQQWRLLGADRSLLPGAIEEILRWAPPNPYNRRTAVRDITFRGTRIRAGEKVTLWWPSANRDESVFGEPDTFDIRRSPNPHQSFGHGRHHCLGANLARTELSVFLTELLDRAREIHLTGPVGYQPSNKHTVVRSLPIELR